MKLVGVTLIVAIVMSVAATAQYKLQYKSTGSMPLHYKANTTVETDQTMMGQESKFNIVSNQFLTVSSIQSGSELVYSTMVDSGENMTILPSGDTKHIPSPSVGKVKETRIKPNGEELSTRWVDSTFANSQAGQMKDLGSFFVKLPSSEIKTGATWNQVKVDTVGTAGAQGKVVVNTNTDYKLLGSENLAGVSCAKIQFSGKVNMKGAASINGMDLAIDGSGTVSGVAYFDYAGGKIMKISGASNQDITMASAGDHPMTIPMTQKSNYELSLTK